MAKIYRFLGKRGRTTIPYYLREELGLNRDDLLSFERHGKTIVVRKEKICDGCTGELKLLTPPVPVAAEPQKKKATKTSGARKTLKLRI